MTRFKAILVDDDEAGLPLMKSCLERMDLDVQCYGDPAKALRDAADGEPDIIFVDSAMPRTDEIGFISAFRRRNAKTPIIMLAGSADRSVMLSALKAGATEFLQKPVRYAELYLRSSNLLHLKQYQNMMDRRASALEQTVKKEAEEIVDSERETLLVLAKAADHKDPETGMHIMRVATYSRLLAKAAEAGNGFCNLIYDSSPLHDVGKVGIPDRILQKKGRLTEEEFCVMKKHTLIGYDILNNTRSKYLVMGKSIAVSHHERFDGSGYPYGLSGERIPVEGRIVAVADVFDALLSERSYKRAWSVDGAVGYVSGQKGRHFDPKIVDAFLSHIDWFVKVYREYRDSPTA